MARDRKESGFSITAGWRRFLPIAGPPHGWFSFPAFISLALSFPVNDYFTAIRRGENSEIPERAPSYLAITRIDFRVIRHVLDPVQFEVLRALSDGDAIEPAIARGVRHSSRPDDEIAAALQEWFFTWTTAGFFRDVIV
jgi:hypothetical protein